jgi:hypothetical protein
MGVVLPFEMRTTRRTSASRCATRARDASNAELTVMAALREGRDGRGILIAARPLLERCRDRYGFTIMRTGLPTAPEVLARALLTLARGLRPLEAELCGRRPFWAYGVYFSEQREPTWFEDGYGCSTGLAVPVGIDPTELSRFVQQRIRALPR